MTRRVVVAVPCHRDEPSAAATVRSLRDSAIAIPDAAVRVVVCVNGADPSTGVAARVLADAPCEVRLLDVPSKPAAWNVLRAEPADIHVFADADVLVAEGSLPALVAALDRHGINAATGVQDHIGGGVVARVANVPHRLDWGGLLGTLYAARTDALPAQMPDGIILDDAWLFAALGESHVVQVADAVAVVQLPTRWRDLWRQRVRTERGKQQLERMNVPLAQSPAQASAFRVWRAYPASEWPFVAALAAVKAAASVRARFGQSTWRLATSTKRPR